MLYARLEKARQGREPAREGRLLRETAATLAFAGCFWGLCALLKVQASKGNHTELQAWQMILRPAFALAFAGLIVTAPFCLAPLRRLLGNPVTAFLSSISMNYYLIHQTLAVHLRRIGFPASVSDTPNMAREQPWQTQYTWAAFGFSPLSLTLTISMVRLSYTRRVCVTGL